MHRAKKLVRPGLVRVAGVQCPVCGHRDRSFRPHGVPVARPNARCPSCGALERHRLFWLFLNDQVGSPMRLGRVLHFAPEAFLAARLRRVSELYTSLDLLRPEMGIDVQGDITALPFSAGAFDIVICSHVLEHVPDDALAMRELRRVLAPGGLLVADVPFVAGQEETLEDPDADEQTRIAVYLQADHVRLYGLSDFRARLERAGFTVAVRTAREVVGRGVRRAGVPAERPLFVCR